MRPTHLRITGRSKFTFTHDIVDDLVTYPRFGQLIQRFERNATLVFSDKVTTVADIQPIINYLVRSGIVREDIRVRFPSETADRLLNSRLASGLESSGLTFGPDVAEHDSGLARYFVATQSYEGIRSGQKHVVLGPKGSGKSAILRELSAEIGDHLVVTPEHYATDVLDSLVTDSHGNELSAYVTTWKYTLLVEMFRIIVQTKGGVPGASELRSYLSSHGHLSTDFSLFDRFAAYLRRITRIRGKIGPTEAEVSLDAPHELEKLFKMDELLVRIPALKQVLRRKSFSILIDELDQSWNNTQTSNDFLIALLVAAIQLRGIDSNLHVIVFLRSEIFELLKPKITQLDKLRTDIEELKWSTRELSNLIVSRAFDALEIDPENASAESIIFHLFPGAVPGAGISVFDYILSRTSYRPREVIQLCNLSLKVAKQLSSKSIGFESVLRAEEEFSGWKLEYIVAENLFTYPGLDMLLEEFRGKGRRLQFSEIDGLLTVIILNKEKDERSPDWLKGGVEPNKLLEVLYRLEIIGVEKANVDFDERAPWISFDFVFSRPKARVEQSASFLLHPGLWRALELR